MPTNDSMVTENGELAIQPIRHASLILQLGDKTIYVDPVGGKKSFAGQPKPSLVLITHLHFDHFDVPTLKAILPDGAKTVLVAPQAVADKIPEALQDRIDLKVLNQGEKIDVDGIPIEAVPAYNTTSGHEKFHPRSRDNGYLLTLGGKRFYIAGDTEDTPEMRALKNIDVAFLPMNQPYTLSVPQAADAIKAFKPKIVYPYHFRSDDGTKADFAQLQKLVGKDAGVEIRVLDWYPGE